MAASCFLTVLCAAFSRRKWSSRFLCERRPSACLSGGQRGSPCTWPPVLLLKVLGFETRTRPESGNPVLRPTSAWGRMGARGGGLAASDVPVDGTRPEAGVQPEPHSVLLFPQDERLLLAPGARVSPRSPGFLWLPGRCQWHSGFLKKSKPQVTMFTSLLKPPFLLTLSLGASVDVGSCPLGRSIPQSERSYPRTLRTLRGFHGGPSFTLQLTPGSWTRLGENLPTSRQDAWAPAPCSLHEF